MYCECAGQPLLLSSGLWLGGPPAQSSLRHCLMRERVGRVGDLAAGRGRVAWLAGLGGRGGRKAVHSLRLGGRSRARVLLP